ncbi:MAG: FAD:protein FMN transferase, partial [Candidatus Moranbacteria bacterium]|nr:FAD:protein FMN transferase [Candidatus Moranbacteria bacterium]
INKNLGLEIVVSPAMLEILLLCQKFNQISKGYFDPRILENLKKIGYDRDFRKHHFYFKEKELELFRIEKPLEKDLKIFPEEKKIIAKREIDTTGIVKGYTVDLVAEFLAEEGFENFIIDAGGDMSIRGLDENGKKWRIGIEGLNNNAVMLAASDVGLATSGISRKKWTVGEKNVHHLINPKNPSEFSYDLKTVAVIEEKTVEADGRAKSLFLMGRKQGIEFANENKIKALFLDYKGNVYLSEEIKKRLF